MKVWPAAKPDANPAANPAGRASHGRALLAALALAASALTAAAQAPVATDATAIDWSISGFGTLGLAQSNRPYRYQRFVDEGGTLKRDSVIGLQWDAKLGRELSATLQAKLAAPTRRDDGVGASIAWGFVSWRPDNDWLLRVGKFRVPLYLHSETQDVGTTFDTATLPVEVYSQSPTNDFTGLSLSRSWNGAMGELVLDAYWGRARSTIRIAGRHDTSFLPGGAVGKFSYFLPVTLQFSGLAFTLRRDEDIFRAAMAFGRLAGDAPFPDKYPFVEIPGLPGVGYYDTLPGSMAPSQARVTIPIGMLGLDVGGPLGTRVAAEFGRRMVKRTLGFDSKGAYVSVRRRWGGWTPYVTLAMLRSTQGDRAEFAAVNAQRVPDFVPQAALINQLQEAGADGMATFDQTSLAAGFSYRLSPNAMLKAEWQQVRIGQTSALIDPPPGTLIHHQRIQLLSLSYSVVF